MSKSRKWMKIIISVVIVLVILGAAAAVYAVSQKSAAEEAALEHAGLKESEVSGLYSELDMDGLSLLCDVSFWTSENKYEYEVTLFGHEVVHFDKENFGGNSAPPSSAGGTDQSVPQDHTGSNHSSYQQNSQNVSVGEADAKAIVLKHAGVDESSVVLYRSEIDTDNGKLIYEIEFYAGEYEYEYEIDCASGEILKYERDKDRP